MNPFILSENDGAVRTLRINRPDQKNALNAAMYQEMADVVDAAAEDDSVRVLCITGSEGVFCAGNDIDDFLKLDPADESLPAGVFMRALTAFPKPVVAAVRGPAVGIGATMLLHCDLIYAAPSTRFLFPFVNLGICPEYASTYLLPRFMGHARAAELLLLAEPFDAEQAERYGMINAIVPDDAVDEHARDIARRLAARPPKALRTTKALLRRWSQETVDRAIRDEAAVFIPMVSEPEAVEAFTAFQEKRKPDFSGFR